MKSLYRKDVYGFMVLLSAVVLLLSLVIILPSVFQGRRAYVSQPSVESR